MFVSCLLIFNVEVTKVLTKIAKASRCEAISEWIKLCTNHLYWSAKTTHDGNGEVIWAKFSSFLSHVVGKHENLDNPVFNKCGHKDNSATQMVRQRYCTHQLGLVLKYIMQTSPKEKQECIRCSMRINISEIVLVQFVTINTICYLDNNSFQFFYRFHCI
jgi:hypothetical protein